MPLPNDITLNDIDYTLVPGGYRKRNAPATPAANPRDVRRLTLGPFTRGQRQAFDARLLESTSRLATAGWDSVGVAPCFDGQGIEPFPHVAAFGDTMGDTPSTTNRAYGVIAGSNAFIGIGRRIYKSVALSNGTWAALTAAADLGAGFAISVLAYYQDDLLVLLSSGQDIRKFNTATNSLTVWRSGEKGQVGTGYKGQLIYAPRTANAQEELRLSGTRWNGNAVTHLRYLDSPILTMALFNGRVAIATRTSLYLMGGEPYPGEPDDATVPADTSKAPEWRGDPEPIMTHGAFAADDDFVFLCSYRGRLYTWLAGRVAEYDDSQEQGRWLRMGPEGAACRGATVAGDWLIVAVTSRYQEQAELWGFDGQGWWLLAQRSSPHAIWPCPLGGAGNRDLIVFRHDTTAYDLYRVKWRSETVATRRQPGDNRRGNPHLHPAKCLRVCPDLAPPATARELEQRHRLGAGPRACLGGVRNPRQCPHPPPLGAGHRRRRPPPPPRRPTRLPDRPPEDRRPLGRLGGTHDTGIQGHRQRHRPGRLQRPHRGDRGERRQTERLFPLGREPRGPDAGGGVTSGGSFGLARQGPRPQGRFLRPMRGFLGSIAAPTDWSLLGDRADPNAIGTRPCFRRHWSTRRRSPAGTPGWCGHRTT
ncbi:MAG: hypothetical protein K0Q71_6144 [Thermomicrobiales bacterium]|nr:hypothetical protein [Thermomicrobiales bacterium]